MIKHEDGSVTLTKDEYDTLMKEHDYLIKRDEWLCALEGAGVDNWVGIDDARDMLEMEDEN